MQCLVSKKVKVSTSFLRGLGLGRENERLGLVLSRSRENVGGSRSCLGLKNKRLGLAPQGLVCITDTDKEKRMGTNAAAG